MKIYEVDNYVVLEGAKDFDLVHIFECGQCFRFKQQEDASFIGVSFGKVWHLDDYAIMHKFLDMDRDYAQIKKSFAIDDFTTKASTFGTGIRILRQEPWKAFYSFAARYAKLWSIRWHLPTIYFLLHQKLKNIKTRG